jgi:quercetin dioxygenase-like cupin family protein
MSTLATVAVADSLTITHAPAEPEMLDLAPGAEILWADDGPDDHHLVVTRGTCRVLGRQLHPGASVYVPAGTPHTIRAGAWGCRLFSVQTAHEIA